MRSRSPRSSPRPGADLALAHVYDWPVWRNNGLAAAIGLEQASEILTPKDGQARSRPRSLLRARFSARPWPARARGAARSGSARRRLVPPRAAWPRAHGRRCEGRVERRSLRDRDRSAWIHPGPCVNCARSAWAMTTRRRASKRSLPLVSSRAAMTPLSKLYGSSRSKTCVKSGPIPADWPETAESMVSRCRDQIDRLEGIGGDAVYGGASEELTELSRGRGPVDRRLPRLRTDVPAVSR